MHDASTFKFIVNYTFEEADHKMLRVIKNQMLKAKNCCSELIAVVCQVSNTLAISSTEKCLLGICYVCKEWQKDWSIDICFYVHKDDRYERNILPCNMPPKTVLINCFTIYPTYQLRGYYYSKIHSSTSSQSLEWILYEKSEYA